MYFCQCLSVLAALQFGLVSHIYPQGDLHNKVRIVCSCVIADSAVGAVTVAVGIRVCGLTPSALWRLMSQFLLQTMHYAERLCRQSKPVLALGKKFFYEQIQLNTQDAYRYSKLYFSVFGSQGVRRLSCLSINARRPQQEFLSLYIKISSWQYDGA